jgi:hypothetical protein
MSNTFQAQAGKSWSASQEDRIITAVSCRDAEPIPKVARACEVLSAKYTVYNLCTKGLWSRRMGKVVLG